MVTGLAALMNAAFAAVGTPQTLGPHLARDAASRPVRADAQSLGLQAYLDPEDPLGPAMLAGVIGSLVPAIAGARARGPGGARRRDPA